PGRGQRRRRGHRRRPVVPGARARGRARGARLRRLAAAADDLPRAGPPRRRGARAAPRLRRDVNLIAHRGASALAPENTLAALRRARADGADGVELDVMACRGGEVVVVHDEDLVRLAGVHRRVADLSLAALRDIRLAGGEVIPLLDEVLEELGPRLLVNVEIKAPRALSATRLVPAVARILLRHGGAQLVSSFNPIALAELRALAPRLPVGLPA